MFKTRKNWLGFHTAICRAPDDLQGFGSFGNGGGSGAGAGAGTGDGAGTGTGFEMPGEQSPLIGVNDGGNESEDVLDEIINAFAPADDDDSDDGQQPPTNPQIPQEQVDQMRQAVQTAIGQMRITDDMIPQDFDPNDRQQLTQFANKIMQQTVANSMNVVFQPVQLAMKQMAMTLQNQIDTKVSQTQNGMKDSAIFESIVPEVNDPKLAGIVKQLDSTIKANGTATKVRERAQLVRKMLNQMGIKSSGSNDRRSSGQGNGGGAVTKREGHAALDSFFGPFNPNGKR